MKTLEPIVKGCRVCVQNQTIAPRPVLSLPLAYDFNNTVAINLQKTRRVLSPRHRFLQSIQKSLHCAMKEASVIANKIICLRISQVQAPPRDLSDNGESDKTFLHLGDKYNTVESTASFSPWSNGIHKRHKAVLSGAFAKMAEGHLNTDSSIPYAAIEKKMLLTIN